RVLGRGRAGDAGGAGPAPDATTAPATGAPATSPTGAPTPRSTGTTDPADALLLLREAAQARSLVWVELVGPDGRSDRRLVRPLRVEGGRLRALDPRREAELTVAVHRIAGVVPADGPA
ncbi:hypothetical protein AB6N23_13200, partial [Cellulomonas sp. 179-A 9B4 NHS]